MIFVESKISTITRLFRHEIVRKASKQGETRPVMGQDNLP